jgi:chaperonin GroES
MIKAVFNNVIIKQDVTGDKMYGSIVLPDMNREVPHIGEIVDIGPGHHNHMGVWIPTTYQVGDKVILPKIGPVRVEYDGDEYLVTPEYNILAIIN